MTGPASSKSPAPRLALALVLALAGGRASVAQEATGPLAPSSKKADKQERSSKESSAPRDPIERIAKPFDPAAGDVEAEVERLLGQMSLEEKIGQMRQVFYIEREVNDALRDDLRAGRIGSIINPASKALVDDIQRIAREESRTGVPLLFGRDVIHGYRTIFPIPLGQAASWNPELIEKAAAAAADEAASQGIDWTFAPMVDICRDPRWGRIAETLGEDPYLGGTLAAAMVRGFQQERDGRIHGLLACAKHYAAYGLSEGGRDYNRASLSISDLHNIYLVPFHAAVKAGCRTFMTTFSEVNGVPGTANRYMLRDVLKQAWEFAGLVVSDWSSVLEMVEHGYSADEAAAARDAVAAGLDMEMASTTFDHLARLVESGAVSQADIDDAVKRILRCKLQLAARQPEGRPGSALMRPRTLEMARRLAQQSIVLLKNDGDLLPLDKSGLARVAVIGPLADAPHAQLGCWIPDGNADDSFTPLEALRSLLGEEVEVTYLAGAKGGFSQDASDIDRARDVASEADAVILFVGEDAMLSGEARSRTEINLPGAQAQLVEAVAAAGKPLVMVVMAGRPLAIGRQCELADAVLYAWHPGTMGGPAIADILFGAASPSGKLPVTFPKSVGQIPLYYGHTNTGRPSPAKFKPLTETGEADLPQEFQYKSHYIDSDPFPLFPFGYGLSYTEFAYDGLELSASGIRPGQTLAVRVRVTNLGKRAGSEIAQLYVRDLTASIVRPVRELKAFRRVFLRPGQSQALEFAVSNDELAYFDNSGKQVLEPGQFAVFVGGDSTAGLGAEFELRTSDADEPAVARNLEARTPNGQ